MSFGIKELLVLLVIVIVIFGTKKLRSLGSDLGTSVKEFKKAVNEGEEGEEGSSDTAAVEEKKEESKQDV